MKQPCNICGNRGVTLVELLVVIGIIAMLAVALGFSFQGWIAKYRVEDQMKTLSADLLSARARAMQRNRTHFVTLTATSYTVYEDTNTAPNGNGTLETANDTVVLTRTLQTEYPIEWNDAADTQLAFNTRGLSLDNKTICSSIDRDADADCLILSESRINLGKLTTSIPNGGECAATTIISGVIGGGDCLAK